MGRWPARCTRRPVMTLQPFASLAVMFACSTATIAGQQSSQTDMPRTVPSTTTSSSGTQQPSPQAPPQPSQTGRPDAQPPQIGRRDAELASAPESRPPLTPCSGYPAGSDGSTSPATSPGVAAFPGVAASQLPRAGVSADKFVRPGVSAAQLATLQPGARSTPCAAPRDVILYPETGTPSPRVPPPGESEP